MKRVAVLGAGPAGLTAALRLAEAGREVIVIDRLPFVGGAAASRPITEGGPRMDFGPHAFHLKNPAINKILYDHYSGELKTKRRNERLLVHNHLFRYPLEILEVLKFLPLPLTASMFGHLVMARFLLRTGLSRKPDTDFESWGLRRFGRPLYRFSCGAYTEKVWGTPARALSYLLAEQKIKEIRLRDIARKLMGSRGEEHKRYWEEYIYPDDGIGIVFENMEKHIGDLGGSFRLGCALAGLEEANGRIERVLVTGRSGELESIPVDAVLSTVPLSHVARALKTSGSSLSVHGGYALKYRGLILINVIIRRDRVTPYDWVYMLDPHFHCNRFTEQKNMGSRMVPEGQTVLCFEYSCDFDDERWNAPDDELISRALADIDRIELINRADVAGAHVARLQDAYPMYRVGFERNLEEMVRTLSGTANLYSVGRQGLFLNTDIHDSMEMAAEAARAITEGRDPASWYSEAWPYVTGRIGFSSSLGLSSGPSPKL